MYNQDEVLWHYTTGNVFRRILQQGAILPDRTEPENLKEVPTVTFSADPVWEKSRFRVGRTAEGKLVMMSKKLLQEYDGGLIRIAVPKELAPLDWFEMKERCGMSKRAIKGIYDFAIEVGARIRDWYSTTEMVPEDVWITVEKLDADDNWKELSEEEIPDVDNEEVTPFLNTVIEIPSESSSVDDVAVVTPYWHGRSDL